LFVHSWNVLCVVCATCFVMPMVNSKQWPNMFHTALWVLVGLLYMSVCMWSKFSFSFFKFKYTFFNYFALNVITLFGLWFLMEYFPYIISGLFMYYTFHQTQLLCITLTELLLNIWLHIITISMDPKFRQNDSRIVSKA